MVQKQHGHDVSRLVLWLTSNSAHYLEIGRLESGAVLALWMIAILVVFIYAAKEDADNEADEHVIFGAYSTAFWTLPQIIVSHYSYRPIPKLLTMWMYRRALSPRS